MANTKSAIKTKAKTLYATIGFGSAIKKEDAQAVGEFINKHKDKSTFQLLEEIEKAKDHVIHEYIEWNNGEAAYKHRCQQVRGIVGSITIVVPEAAPPVRAFYNVKKTAESPRVYVNIQTMHSSDYMREQVISRAKTELQNWKARYQQYNELKDIIEFIDRSI